MLPASNSATSSVISNIIPVTGPTTDFTTGDCYLYRSLRCKVAPQTFFNPAMNAKKNDELTVMFSKLQGPVVMRFAYDSQLTPLAADSWLEETLSLPLTTGYANRATGFADGMPVPNDHARSWLINAGVRWVMSHGYARLEGLYLESKDMVRGSPSQVAG